MADIETLIRRPIHTAFRKAYVKRRDATTALYETTWYDITEFVKKWGSYRTAIDDLRLNRFTQSGITLTMRNDTGAFNTEDNINSIWNGYLTRYKSLIKIEGGYYDGKADITGLPTNPSLGIFIMNDEIPIDTARNQAVIKCRSLTSIFDEVRASEITGLGTTQTASQLIAKVRDHTDGSGSLIFRQIISQSSWTIQSTTNYYNFATSTALENQSAWDFMVKLAESEGFIVYVTRLGGIEFSDRNANTTASQFDFFGNGFPRPNIIELTEYKEAINKYYNFIRLKYQEEDTLTSYVESGSTTVINPSSTAWKYGVRTYQFENTFIPNTTTAQTISDNLLTEFGTLKNELSLEALFIPHLDISDRVGVNYRSYDITKASLWDQMFWDIDNWDAEEGENFEFEDEQFKILSISTNLDQFTTTFKLREV